MVILAGNWHTALFVRPLPSFVPVLFPFRSRLIAWHSNHSTPILLFCFFAFLFRLPGFGTVFWFISARKTYFSSPFISKAHQLQHSPARTLFTLAKTIECVSKTFPNSLKILYSNLAMDTPEISPLSGLTRKLRTKQEDNPGRMESVCGACVERFHKIFVYSGGCWGDQRVKEFRLSFLRLKLKREDSFNELLITRGGRKLN